MMSRYGKLLYSDPSFPSARFSGVKVTFHIRHKPSFIDISYGSNNLQISAELTAYLSMSFMPDILFKKSAIFSEKPKIVLILQ